MYKKVISIVKVTLCSMALIGLLTACGSTTNVENVESAVNNKVVESTTVAESEPTTAESEATTETNVVEESKEATTETVVTEESEVASGEGDKDPNFNGAGHEGTLEQTEQTYITYESIDPVTMYVINNTNGERYPTYHDPNVTDGELYESGLVDANQELQIDGKATYNGTDYYRLVFQEEMMLNHQIIIPADLVVAELQETPEVQQPVETPAPEVEQQPSTQEQTPPPAENNTPEWDSSTGISQDDWNAFFGGGNTTGQHNWTPDRNSEATVERNENGGFTVNGSGLSQEELEEASKHTWE